MLGSLADRNVLKNSLNEAPSAELCHEREDFHDSGKRDFCLRRFDPGFANLLWLARRDRRLVGADVDQLGHRRHRGSPELPGHKPRDAEMTTRHTTRLLDLRGFPGPASCFDFHSQAVSKEDLI
jgi:hypothetical protein